MYNLGLFPLWMLNLFRVVSSYTWMLDRHAKHLTQTKK